MKRFCLKMFSMLLPTKSLRRKFRQRFVPKAGTPSFKHKAYKKLYYPYYSRSREMPSNKPCIYNRFGEKMDVFFIRDTLCIDEPYIDMAESKAFIWDRFNVGLDTHFYTHNSMLETMGKPVNKYGWMLEAESIVPEDYKMFKRHKGLEKEFESIFT